MLLLTALFASTPLLPPLQMLAQYNQQLRLPPIAEVIGGDGVDGSSAAALLGGDVEAGMQYVRSLCQAMGQQAGHTENAWALAKVGRAPMLNAACLSHP